MPLVTSTEMFKKAYDGGYAIGAFNVNNMEIVQGITEACQEEHAPVLTCRITGARSSWQAAGMPCTISMLLTLNAPMA